MSAPPAIADRLSADPGLADEIRRAVKRVVDAAGAIAGVRRPVDAEVGRALARRIHQRRGRPLFFDGIVGSGLGRGALVELADGSVKYDFITAIGTNFFGHSDPDLLETAARAALADVAMQGNLHPNREYLAFLDELLSRAPARLNRAWLATSGADANENALKVARQKRPGARFVLAFQNCFAGRTTTMAEITDSPGYRKGQPLRGEALYVPFFDPKDPAGSTDRAERAVTEHLHRCGDQISAMAFELIQGEGGFNSAPRDFFLRLIARLKAAGVLVWIDEIQTFGRTRELFATTMLGLEEEVDLVTIGKLAQVAATLHTEALTPDPGLLSGTFSGSTVSLAVGRRVIERLATEGFYGDAGRNGRTERAALEALRALETGRCKGWLRDPHAIGTMVSFVPFDGEPETVNKVLRAAYERGVIAFMAGHHPTKIRLLLPGGAVTEDDLRAGIGILGDALEEVARARAGTGGASESSGAAARGGGGAVT